MVDPQREQLPRSREPAPKAILISDIHYTPATLQLAHSSMRQALSRAEELGVPLIDGGDILDTKSIIRAECANALIELLKLTKVQVILNVGNHTLLNSHSKEHALNFLKPYCTVVAAPEYFPALGLWIVPYRHDQKDIIEALTKIPKGSTVIMHQGVLGAEMGHYVQDKSSLPPETFADYRVISGHYHKAQDIKTGPLKKGAVGLFSYVGNPYTLSFGEAHDGPKGFQILYDDGSMRQVPTNLRRHVIAEMEYGDKRLLELNPDDLLWLKMTGTREQLDSLDKTALGQSILGHSNFKLDKIYPEAENVAENMAENSTDEELFDAVIDANEKDAMRNAELKKLWRELV